MINKIQIVLLAIVIPILALFFYSNSKGISISDFFALGTPVMHMGGIPVRVEIAITDEERSRGLSGRKKLEDVNGLLFVFPKTDYHTIWMKDMLFPIDIIWISEDLTIINIQKNISPNSFPSTFRPDKPARYAVETNTHYADTFGIREGQNVKLPLDYLKK